MKILLIYHGGYISGFLGWIFLDTSWHTYCVPAPQKLRLEGPMVNYTYQIDGVAMGSPLGPTFANFYMGNLEKSVLSDQNIEPTLRKKRGTY